MKGIVSSLIIFLSFITIFSFVYMVSTKNLEMQDVATTNLILDKVYYKFNSIEFAVVRTLQEAFGYNGMNITLVEDGFNLITLTENLPQDMTTFNGEMDKLENFAESKANETNMVISLDFQTIKDWMPLYIFPYNISYIHPNGFGQRDLKVLPGNSWSYLNGYIMNLTVNSTLGSDGGSWNSAACKNNGDLTWNITVVGIGSTYNKTNVIKRSANCNFNINTPGGSRILQVSNEDNSILTITVNPGFNITSTITLNLTDIPGKVRLCLAPQSIKVKETLYEIEKNDTVCMY